MARQLDLDPNGDLLITGGRLQIIDGAESICQTLYTGLQVWRGEWFADQSVGLPFQDVFFKKSPSIPVIRAVLREAIEETPGVLSIETLDFEFNQVTRQMTISARVQVDGEGGAVFREIRIEAGA